MEHCRDHIGTIRELTEIKTLISGQVIPALDTIKLTLDGKPHLTGTGVRGQVQDDRRRIDALEQDHGQALIAHGRKVDEVLTVLRGTPGENGDGGLVGRVRRLEQLKDRVMAIALGVGLGAGFGAVGLERLARLVF